MVIISVTKKNIIITFINHFFYQFGKGNKKKMNKNAVKEQPSKGKIKFW